MGIDRSWDVDSLELLFWFLLEILLNVFAWDLKDQYGTNSGVFRRISQLIQGLLLSRYRIWDFIAAQRVDEYIANSAFIGSRIQKVYRRSSEVVYPPVDTEKFLSMSQVDRQVGDYFVTCSRLVPYKRVDVIVEAFRQMADKKLVVIGDGPEFKKISKGCPSNVEMSGFLPFDEMILIMRKARGFIFAAKEDFGIAPIEAQAVGLPVIAYGAGAALETINTTNQPSGVYFEEQTPASLISAIEYFERNIEIFTQNNCQTNAARFSESNFEKRFSEVMEGFLSKI